MRSLGAVPLRLVAVLVAIPTRLSVRLLRLSIVTAGRSVRLAVRSSAISFVLGLGLGWFLTTPTGRYLVALVVDAVRRQSDPVDDDALADRVRAELASSAATWHLPQPEVSVAGGVVTLTGGAPHDEGRSHLASTAAGIQGVVSVVDQVTVVHPAAPPAGSA